MIRQLRAAATLLGVFTLILGILYPAAMTAFAVAAFPAAAGGSLVTLNGRSVGSSLIGQRFAGDFYLHPRPSAAGDGYDASASAGTNLAPTSAQLAERLTVDGDAIKAATGVSLLPADSVTTSASGLDPDVSPAFAALQAPRIANARGMALTEVKNIIIGGTSGRTFGFLGEPRVNVLAVNMALDAAASAAVHKAAP